MTDLELGWVVGLLEGEGCFCIQHRSSPQVKLAMTDLDVVKRFKQLVGSDSNIKVTASKYKTQKVVYTLCVNGKPAMALMRLVLPYMGERRSIKIRQIIEHILTVRPGIDRDKDTCARGHSVKYSSEYYLGVSGSRTCKRCMGINVPVVLGVQSNEEN